MKIAISACLAGDSVRYDASNKRNDDLLSLLKDHEIIKICPEISADLTIPRDPIEILNNHVITSNNIDITDKLYKGCLKCFEMIKDCDFVILKDKSPSCGYGKIYDGTFSNKLIDGNGIFTDLCLRKNIKVFNEKQLAEIKEHIFQ